MSISTDAATSFTPISTERRRREAESFDSVENFSVQREELLGHFRAGALESTEPFSIERLQWVHEARFNVDATS